MNASTQAFSAFSKEARQLRTLFEWGLLQFATGWSMPVFVCHSGIPNRSTSERTAVMDRCAMRRICDCQQLMRSRRMAHIGRLAPDDQAGRSPRAQPLMQKTEVDPKETHKHAKSGQSCCQTVRCAHAG